eukprot:c25366_g1_i1 orf=102-539(+)
MEQPSMFKQGNGDNPQSPKKKPDNDTGVLSPEAVDSESISRRTGERTVVPSEEEIISESAAHLKEEEAVGKSDMNSNVIISGSNDRGVVKSMGAIIAHKVQSVKEAMLGNSSGEINHSSEGGTVAHAVKDETGEVSILVHSTVHD